MSASYWGKFVNNEASREEVIPAEIIKFFIMKAMRADPLWSPGPQPTISQQASSINLPLIETKDSKRIKQEVDLLDCENLEMDDRVMHTIKLLKHGKEMRQMIEAAREHMDLMANSQMPSFPPALDIPDHPVAKPKHHFQKPLPYMNKEITDFVLGKGKPTVEVSENAAKMLLKKSTAVMLAHSGFDKTSENVLCTVTDSVEQYIKNIVNLLRVAVDQGANFAATGFPDPIERVFHEVGLGSVRVLHEYYQDRVLKFYQQVLEDSRALNAEYNSLAFPPKQSISPNIKLEEPDEVPEIHFFAMDENAVEDLQASLEPGFQIQIQGSLESQEEGFSINSVSPSVESTEISGGKKRRRN